MSNLVNVQKGAHSGRIEELDSLRGIMALIVALFHFTAPHYYFNGSLAVDFFFILSGLVIAASWERRSTKGENLEDFAVRRLARLYPLHFFSLAVVVVLYAVFILLYNYPKADSLWMAISWHFPEEYYKDGVIFTLVQSILLLNCVGFNPSGVFWNGPSWSISVEFWANVIAFQWCRQRSSLFLVVTVILLYVALYNEYHRLGVHYEVLFGVLNGGLARGLAGMIIGLLICRYSPKSAAATRRSVGQRLLSGVMQATALATVLTVMHASAGTSNDYLALLASTTLIASLYRHRDTFSAWLLRFPPLVFLGTISYSIYLNHFAIQYILQDLFHVDSSTRAALVVFLLILIPYSWLTYRFIELSGQKLIRKRALAAREFGVRDVQAA